MLPSKKPLTLAMLGGVALLGLALPAQAQIPYTPYDPYGMARRAAFQIGLLGRAYRQVPPYALGYNPYPQVYAPGAYIPRFTSVGPVVPPVVPPINPLPGYPAYANPLVNNPYAASSGYNYMTSSGYGGYDPGYNNAYMPYWDPYSGFLRGMADIIGAEGRFRINNQQANLIRENVKQASIENRRRAFDEWMYERANLPTVQQIREEWQKADLRYHVTSASGPDIASGIALNTILGQLRQMQAKGQRGPTISLDPETLRQLNVTSDSGSNAGLLKNEGRLTWPVALTAPTFDAERKNLERNLPLAISEVQKSQQVDRARLTDMQNDLDRLDDQLVKQISTMTLSQYADAKRYLNLLRDALRVLSSPDAVNYFNNKYAASGKTVGDLVKNMGGLRFAPATPGEEKAYHELYNALLTYFYGAQSSATAAAPAPPPAKE